MLLSTAGDLCFVRTAVNLTTLQKEKKQTEHKIQPDEANQCEDRVAVAHYFAVAFARRKNAVDQPRLTPQFGSHPSQGVGNVRKRKCQHQHPEQPIAECEPAAPIL